MTPHDENDERRVDDALHSFWESFPVLSDDELGTLASTARREPREIERRRRRPTLLWAGIAGLALLVGSGLGFGLGSTVTPSSTAAGTVVGLGFLPEPGWDVLQTGAAATRDQPVVAIAANGAFAPDDAARGIRNSSGLPYSTLLALPRPGIVVVARFTFTGHQPASDLYPSRTLPLRLRDASPWTAFRAQVRPERPLGQYLLRAAVNGHSVELQIYFGTPRPSQQLIEAAQRQLDRLVVNPQVRGAAVRSRALPLPASSVQATPPSRLLDRTLACSTAFVGGARSVEVRGHRGTGRMGSTWNRPAFAAVTSGRATSGGPSNPSLLDNSLVWITAGRPSASSTLVEEHLLSDLYRTRLWGTLAINTRTCRASKAPVNLRPQGLQGGALGPFADSYTCSSPRRVLVRVRAVLASRSVLRRFNEFGRTTVPVREGAFVVQTEAGRRLAYAEVSESGSARLFTARGCFPS
jgi:hypothetical protein